MSVDNFDSKSSAASAAEKVLDAVARATGEAAQRLYDIAGYADTQRERADKMQIRIKKLSKECDDLQRGLYDIADIVRPWIPSEGGCIVEGTKRLAEEVTKLKEEKGKNAETIRELECIIGVLRSQKKNLEAKVEHLTNKPFEYCTKLADDLGAIIAQWAQPFETIPQTVSRMASTIKGLEGEVTKLRKRLQLANQKGKIVDLIVGETRAALGLAK